MDTLLSKKKFLHSSDCLNKQSSCIQMNKVLMLNPFPHLIFSSSIGNVYNIPICLWLLDTYPYNPPICFVKPTSAMMIKPGKHVDANGKIYLPYLHEWKPVSVFFFFLIFVCLIQEGVNSCIFHLLWSSLLQPQSNLLGLIQMMIMVFGEEPPVFSRPSTQATYPAYPAAGPPNSKHILASDCSGSAQYIGSDR